jgi:hypothetical protein
MAKKWTKDEINTVLDSKVLRELERIAAESGRSIDSVIAKYKTENKKLDQVVMLFHNNIEVSEITAKAGERVTIVAKLKDGKYSNVIRWYFQGQVLGIATKTPTPVTTTCTAELYNAGTAKVGIVYEGINKSVLITVEP